MSEKKPSGIFWMTVVLVAALVLYPLSIGPVCCLHEHNVISDQSYFQLVFTVYLPIVWLDEHGPVPLKMLLESYATLWRKGF